MLFCLLVDMPLSDDDQQVSLFFAGPLTVSQILTYVKRAAQLSGLESSVSIEAECTPGKMRSQMPRGDKIGSIP